MHEMVRIDKAFIDDLNQNQLSSFFNFANMFFKYMPRPVGNGDGQE